MSWWDPIRLAKFRASTGIQGLDQNACGKVVRRLMGCSRTSSQRNAEYAVGPQGYRETGNIIYNPATWISNTGEVLTEGFGWVFRDLTGSAVAVTQYAKTDAQYLAQVAATASSNGLDPSKTYATGRFDNPAGNAGKDIVYILYSIDAAGTATPIRVQTKYYASGWVDGTRAWVIQMAEMALTIYTAGLGSAAYVDPDAVGALGLTQSQTTAITFTAQQAAAVNPDIGIAGKVIGLANGQVEVAKVDESDFSDAFGSFDYSSGEATTAYSDVSNVDYGFGAESAGFGGTYDYGAGTGVDPNQFGDAYNYNGTAESIVSDYGSSSMGNAGFDSADIKSLSSGISVASQLAKVGASNNSVSSGASISGGGQKYSQTAASVASTIAKATSTSEGSAPAISGIGGLISQIESALPKTFTGQLGANKTTPQSGTISNQMLWIGAALVGVALLIHFKG